MTLIYFIIILGIIIFIHELGHFTFAKIFGVYVYEFSLGMGPKIFGKKGKNGETEYCLRAIPIGGYVQLAGEEVDDDKKIPKKRKLYAKPAWQRFLIMLFGPMNNFILALVLLFLFGLIYGAPVLTPTITKVTPNYPMEIAGVESGDKIVSINGHKTSTLDDVQLYLTMYSKGESVKFEIQNKDGVTKKYDITPVKEKKKDTTSYKYGVEFKNGNERGLIKSIKYSFVKFGALMKQMVIVIKALFTGGISLRNLSGPVGIYSVVGQASTGGISSVVPNLIQLIILLSVNVGFINLIPFPAFDGGRILFVIIEKIKGSPVSTKVENAIHSVGFIILILLMLYVTFNDILKLF